MLVRFLLWIVGSSLLGGGLFAIYVVVEFCREERVYQERGYIGNGEYGYPGGAFGQTVYDVHTRLPVDWSLERGQVENLQPGYPSSGRPITRTSSATG